MAEQKHEAMLKSQLCVDLEAAGHTVICLSALYMTNVIRVFVPWR